MRQVLTVLFFSIFAMGAKAQFMDTIKLNVNLAATLEFTENIENIVYGNNPVVNQVNGRNIYENYDEFRSKNKAVIAANNKNVPFTTISVFLENGDLYWGYLEYTENPVKVHYPFVKEGEGKKSENEGDFIKDRLKQLMAQPQEYYDFGVELGKIEFLATNIMNDEKRTYIKLVVSNRSAGNFVVKGITFSHEERKKDMMKQKKDEDPERKKPVSQIVPDNNQIPAYSNAEFGYVIPLFTTAEGKLIITCYEESGTRDLVIKIKARDITKIKVF